MMLKGKSSMMRNQRSAVSRNAVSGRKLTTCKAQAASEGDMGFATMRDGEIWHRQLNSCSGDDIAHASRALLSYLA